jgi:hypothetical protein
VLPHRDSRHGFTNGKWSSDRTYEIARADIRIALTLADADQLATELRRLTRLRRYPVATPARARWSATPSIGTTR